MFWEATLGLNKEGICAFDLMPYQLKADPGAILNMRTAWYIEPGSGVPRFVTATRAFEVEFVGYDGHTIALVTLEREAIRPLQATDIAHTRTVAAA